MPHTAAKIIRPVTSRRRPASLFGAVGPQAAVVTRDGDSQRERAQAEAARIGGNFYVDRMMGSLRLR